VHKIAPQDDTIEFSLCSKGTHCPTRILGLCPRRAILLDFHVSPQQAVSTDFQLHTEFRQGNAFQSSCNSGEKKSLPVQDKVLIRAIHNKVRHQAAAT